MALTEKEREAELKRLGLTYEEALAKLDEIYEEAFEEMRREEEERNKKLMELRAYNIAHGIKDCMVLTDEDYEYMIKRMSSVDTGSFKKFPKGSKEREEEKKRILQRIEEVSKEFC